MIIYNYYKDTGYLGITVFVLFSVLFCGIGFCQIVSVLKMIFNHASDKTNIEFLARIPLFLIVLIFSIYFMFNSIKLGKMCYIYSTQNYSVVSGPLNQIVAVYDNYRDNELYDISFCIGDTKFENTNIRCTTELLGSLLNADGIYVTVYYSEAREGCFVHAISIS